MNKPRLICIVASGQPLRLPYLLRGVASYGRQLGTWSFCLRFNAMPNLENDLAALEPDGVLLATEDTDLATTVAEMGLPTVNLCHLVPPTLAPCLWLDNEGIGTVGAQHLAEQGFEHLAFCGLDTSWSTERENGFVRCLGEQDRGCRSLTLNSGSGGQKWERTPEDEACLQGWLQKLKKPVAVMCADDDLAVSLAIMCRQAGLDVPAEVALLGAGNVELLCEFADPPISSVDPNLVRVGHDGAELLDALMDGQPPPKEPVLMAPLGVKPRESTTMVAPEDELVSEALEYIRDNIAEPIGVEDILEALPTSRSSLQRRFRETLGRSPGEEIRRMRLERVRDLVLNTDMPLAEIAEASGFEYISHLCKAFKGTYGMSPKRYRRHHRGYSSALIPLSEVDPEALATYRALEKEAEKKKEEEE
jgi:LacI family transcriptional regulator